MAKTNLYGALPNIMAAPNGARRTKADHPELPVTIAETVATARACFSAGADGLHAHVRDEDGKHILDSGLYRELLTELHLVVPDMFTQITTEAVGQYQPDAQRKIVADVKPASVSISIKEMLSQGESDEISRFYKEQADNGTTVQHILYSDKDVDLITQLCARDFLPKDGLQLLFVLGRYTEGQVSKPDDLSPFIKALTALNTKLDIEADWACCAFGQQETDCLLQAMNAGGKVRIGFENNLYNRDGSLAQDNADRIKDLISAKSQGC